MGGDSTIKEMVPAGVKASPKPLTSSMPKKRRALKIALIVFACLFVLTIGTRIAIGQYIFHKGTDLFEEVINPMIGEQLGKQVYGEEVNVTSWEEANQLMEQARQHQQENWDRAKRGEPVIFYEDTRQCLLGGVTYEVNDHNRKEICDADGDGTTDCGDCGDRYFKATNLENLSDYVITLYAESLVLFLTENVNHVAQKFDEEKQGTLDIVGATLSILQVVGKITIVWASIIPMMQEGENHTGGNTDREQYFLWDEDSLDKLSKLEKFAENIPNVTEDQINAIDFRGMCVNTFIESYKSDIPDNPAIAAIFYVFNSRNLLPVFEDACGLVEDHEKELLLDILERSRKGTVPTSKAIEKYYLMMIVDCSTLMYDRNTKRDDCNYGEDIQSLFDEAFEIVREEED